jgi:predicted DNA-binding protein with PD1-like motif
MNAKLLIEANGQKTFVLIFDTGDEVVKILQSFAREKKLACSHFTAIGAFQEATLGYYDLAKKDYQKNPVREQVEVLSLVGDIALAESGETKVHAHAVLGRSDGSTLGGHLLDAVVRPTLEVMLTEAPVHLQRRHDAKSGLALIRLGYSKGEEP